MQFLIAGYIKALPNMLMLDTKVDIPSTIQEKLNDMTIEQGDNKLVHGQATALGEKL